jgi:hypothetical protein
MLKPNGISLTTSTNFLVSLNRRWEQGLNEWNLVIVIGQHRWRQFKIKRKFNGMLARPLINGLWMLFGVLASHKIFFLSWIDVSYVNNSIDKILYFKTFFSSPKATNAKIVNFQSFISQKIFFKQAAIITYNTTYLGREQKLRGKAHYSYSLRYLFCNKGK